MSPVPGSAAVTFSGTTLPAAAQAAHIHPSWNNPLPESFSNFTNINSRTHCYQAKNNMWLEMHPNGVRGLNFTTKYCVLNITIYTINMFAGNGSEQSPLRKMKLTDQSSSGNNGKIISNQPQSTIQSFETGKFLCMNDESVIYQNDSFDQRYCVFSKGTGTLIDQFFRQVNASSPEWYIGLNKDGTMRCGNVTKQDEEGAMFSRIDVNGREFDDSPEFKNKNKKLKCCKRKRCKNRRPKRCKQKKKKQCRTMRRKFFELTLKQLRKYFKYCVKKQLTRHCKKNRKNKKS